MIFFTQFAIWMFAIIGYTHGNHNNRVMTAGIGRVGNPILSIDPFSVQSSGRLSGSQLSSVSSPSGLSGGTGRTISASATIGVQPRSSGRRTISMRRGLPVLSRTQGRPMIIIRPSGQGSQVVRRLHPQTQRLRGQRTQYIQNNGLLDSLGIAPSSIVTPLKLGLSHAPPGLSFVGGQRLSGSGGQYIPVQTLPTIVNPPVSNQVPITLTGLSSIAGGGSVLNGQQLVQLPVSQPTNPNSIPGSSNLEIGGLTPKGELIIRGPGGSITIGPELLTGISRNNPLPLFTEFEEMELEGAAAAAQQAQGGRNALTLTEPGRGSIVIDRSPPKAATAASSKATAASSSAGVIEVLNAGSSAGSVASSSASASAASSSASAGGASSSASASVGGGGITVESGGKSGRVIRLGDAPGKTQVITMGGAKDQIQFADGGSGIKVPGNATFIVP